MKNKKIIEVIVQFVKFGFVGAINTVLSYIITNTSYYVAHLNEQISNIIAFVITVFISYILNNKFVFNKNNEKNKKRFSFKALTKVYISYAFTGLLLTGILLYIEERNIGIPHYIATLINLVITIPLNFLLNKFWAYKDKE